MVDHRRPPTQSPPPALAVLRPYASETFPNHLHDKGVNISQAGQQITTLWINQTWFVVFANVGHDAYWILVANKLCGLFVVLLFWPDTKGVSLEHMVQIFGEVDKVDSFKTEHQLEKTDQANAHIERIVSRTYSRQANAA